MDYEKMELDFTGRYENRANGLQDKCDYISDVAQDKIEGNIDWWVNFNNSFALNTTINGDWYKRYPVITGDFYKIEDYAASVGIIDFNPKSVFTWKNKKNFYASVLAEYNLEYDTKDSFYDTRAINRGNFGFALGWNNDFVKIYGSSSAIIGNETGNHSVVVPFTAGADFSLKNGLSSRKILISAKGGIDSYLPKVENLERFYKFSAAKVMPAETSDWLGSLDVSIPLKDMFTFNAKGEFRSTAYDNGTYHPVYDIDEEHPDFGQYTYIEDFMNVGCIITEMDMDDILNELGDEIGVLVIVEDGITAGTAIRESMAILAPVGAKVAATFVMVDRKEKGQTEKSAMAEVGEEFGFPVYSVVDVYDIIEYLEEDPANEENVTRIKNYLAVNGAK